MPINDSVYEEVVRIVIDAKQALADADAVGKKLSEQVQKAFRQHDNTLFRQAKDLRMQVEGELQREIEKAKIEAIKETYRRKMGISKEAAREEREIEKALHQYRSEARKAQERADMEAIRRTTKAMEDAEQQRLEFSKRYNKFRMEQSEVAAQTAAQPGFMQKMGQTSNFLRTGAAVAGMTGNFQLAAGFYGLERVAVQAGLAETSILKVGAGFGALAGAAALAGTALWTTFRGNEFNEALHDMGTLLSEVNEKDLTAFNNKLDDLAVSAVKVSVAFNSNLIDVVRGFKTALSSGIEANDLENFSMIVGNVSTALGTSFDATTNILTSFKDAYNLSVNEMGLVGDKLFRLIDVGKVNVQELMSSFGRLIPVAANAGVSITDAFAGVAALSRSGMSTSQSVTALTQMISKMVNPSEKAKKAFNELGIEFGAAAFSGRTLSEVVAELKAKTEGQGDLIGRLFPEERAKRGAAGLRTILELLEKSAAEIDGSAGAAAKAAFAKMDTFTTKMGQIGKVFTGLVAIVGKDLLEDANKVFFGEGPLSETTLYNVKVAFSGILDVVRAVGVTLLTIPAMIKDIFNGIYQVSAGVGHLAKSAGKGVIGDFDGASNSFDDAKFQFGGVGQNTAELWAKHIDQQVKSLARLRDEKEKLESGGSSDSDTEFVDPYVKMELAAGKAGDELLTLSDRQAKLYDARVLDKATQFEKQTLEMYENQITKLEEILDLKQRAASAFATEVVNTQMPGATAKQKARMHRGIVASESERNGSEGLNAQITEFTKRVKDMKREIDARAFSTEQVDAWNSVRNAIGRVWSDFGELAHKEAVKRSEKNAREIESYNNNVLKAAERIYKADVSAYEKAQDDKLAYLRRVFKDMEDAGKKNAAIMDRLQDARNRNELGGDIDPDRRRRLAEKQMAQAREMLEGSTTSEEAKRHAENYQTAAEARRESTEDSRRGARNFDADISAAMAIVEAIGAREKAQGQNKLNRANTQNLVRPDFKSAAAQAVKEVQLKVSVQEAPEIKVKLVSDGKSLDFIAEHIKTKIEIEEQNQTAQPKFPRKNFDTSVR